MTQSELLKSLIERFEVFLFDFDGVFVQSERVKFRAYQAAFKKLADLDIDDGEMKWVGLNEVDVVQFYCKRFQVDNGAFDAQALIEAKREWYKDYQQNQVIPLTEGLREYLGLLQGAQKTIGLVTSSRLADVEMILNKHEDLPEFKVLITAEDVAKRKPDPEPYLVAMQRLAVDPKKVVVFEDSRYGIESADKSGSSVVVLDPFFDPLSQLPGVIGKIESFRLA